MFANRQLYIATKHNKELVIAPIMEKGLSVKCTACDGLDTDVLGTFSGEVERVYSPLDTVRKKCELAISKTKCDLVIASEGSFTSHPLIGFVPVDEEILFFYDVKNEIEIITKVISTKTNYRQGKFLDYKNLAEFAVGIKFPSHAIILKDNKNSRTIKGINDWKKLKNSFHELLNNGPVTAETDMRAMFNPSRMDVIKCCTQKLLSSILSRCPNCNFPGFMETDSVSGLPCQACGLPTSSIIKNIFKCKKCDFISEKFYPNKKVMEDPMYCDYCNP